jgi:hypothetical protein
MTLVSRLAEFQARLAEATDEGLIAAATFVANDIKARLAQGYTSGAFTTGNIADSVTVSEPYDGAEASGDIAVALRSGDRAIEIGTDVIYGKFWELGHQNIFTRRFERVEIWRPTLEEDGPEAIEIFAATVRDLIADDFN